MTYERSLRVDLARWELEAVQGEFPEFRWWPAAQALLNRSLEGRFQGRPLREVAEYARRYM